MNRNEMHWHCALDGIASNAMQYATRAHSQTHPHAFAFELRPKPNGSAPVYKQPRVQRLYHNYTLHLVGHTTQVDKYFTSLVYFIVAKNRGQETRWIMHRLNVNYILY